MFDFVKYLVQFFMSTIFLFNKKLLLCCGYSVDLEKETYYFLLCSPIKTVGRPNEKKKNILYIFKG